MQFRVRLLRSDWEFSDVRFDADIGCEVRSISPRVSLCAAEAECVHARVLEPGSGKGGSLVARLLDRGGLSVDRNGEKKRAVSGPGPDHGPDHGPGNGDEDGDEEGQTGIVTKTRPKTKRPSMYKVLLLNDDYTPMEFVIHVLERFFGKSRDEATEIMLHVHHKGVGICGVYTYEVAETKVTVVTDFARKNQHPLQCTMEKE